MVELIVVVGVVVILMGIVLVAINPARRFAEARNAERWSNVNAVLNAVIKFTADRGGTYPANIDTDTATVQLVGTGLGITCAADLCSDRPDEQLPLSDCFANLGGDLVDEYLASIPGDPQASDPVVDTRYYVDKTAGGRIVVGACDEDPVGGSTTQIEVSR